jgi:membrane associated rhomboid family serine protease
MILITAFITALINIIISKKQILGASGIVYMLILLSSLVNIEADKIPVTLVLIFMFYIVNEIKDGLFKRDNISHISHLIGAITGFIYGFYIF